MPEDDQQVTRLLKEWAGGNKQALDQLMPLVYDQLRTLAARCLSAERPEHTLRATALVNEAYLRLVNVELNFNDRVHFYAVAARLLRHILVDHAKSLNRAKRGGGVHKLSLDEALVVGQAARVPTTAPTRAGQVAPTTCRWPWLQSTGLPKPRKCLMELRLSRRAALEPMQAGG